MTEPLLRLKSPATAEITVRNSRFISTLRPIADLSEVRPGIEAVRADHPGANHVVHAAGARVEEEQFGTAVSMRLVCEMVLVDRIREIAADAARGAITWEGPPRSRFV